uniref:Uncharacterized protein n=1 Tax=Arundo donax TaxID=35708 RepID=A0A0A9EEB2_ARUDO
MNIRINDSFFPVFTSEHELTV